MFSPSHGDLALVLALGESPDLSEAVCSAKIELLTPPVAFGW